MLTTGCISDIVRGAKESSPTFTPIVQILNIKALGSTSDRYRLIVSDGDHFISAMLATQHNEMVRDGQMENNAIIRVDEFMQNVISNRTILILLRFTVLQKTAERIGTPTEAQRAGIRPNTSSTETPAPMYSSSNGNNLSVSQAIGSVNRPMNGNHNNGNNPYSASSSSAHVVSPARSAAAPIVRSHNPNGGAQITPISALNMYQNRWTIKARITSKSEIRHWSNARGEGCLFSIELLDSTNMDIKATFFKEAVDKFYNVLEENSVYTFSGGRLKVANTQYNTCKSNFEIGFDEKSDIRKVDDEGDISAQIFELRPIAAIQDVPAGTVLDILAVVSFVGQPTTLTSKKTGNELTKCDLMCVDDSGAQINLTLWGEKASRAPNDYGHNPIVAFRRLRVSDYGGKSLSTTTSGTSMVLNDNDTSGVLTTETARLRAWWQQQQQGDATRIKSLSSSMGGGSSGRPATLMERKTISTIKEEHLGMSSADGGDLSSYKPDWISFKGTFTFLKKDKEGGAWYPACPNANEPCKNRFKVTQTTDGNWQCDKCQGTFPDCVRRWIFSATVADDSSTTWVSLFNEQAEALFGGATADDVFAQIQASNQEVYDAHFYRANFTEWVFKCKVKQEMVGDESRVKTSVYSLHPVDYAQECRELLQALSAM